MKRDWTNITLKDWYEMQDILAVQDEWTMYNLLDYLYDIDSSSMPISEVKKYNLGFLADTTALDNYKIDKSYDEKYDINLDITNLSVAQFIDFQNYSKETEPRFEKLVSCFIFPKGHTYNDGYDIKEVQNDILNWPFAMVKKISFFLTKQLQTFISLTLYYLKAEMEKMEIPKNKELSSLMEKVISLNSELCHTS